VSNKSNIHQLRTGRSPTVVNSRCRPPKKLASAVSRSRLDQALAKARKAGTTLLVAPAGTGKTELLSQWSQALHQQRVASAWLTLTKTDKPLEMMMASILESFRRAIAPEQQPREDILPMRELQDRLVDLINHLDSCGQTVVFFVDGYDSIADEDVHDVLRRFILDLPANVSTIIASRRPVPWSVSKLRVSGELKVLGYQEIRFDDKETKELIAQHEPFSLDDDVTRELVRSTDGWVAAIHMALIAMQPGLSKRQMIRIVNGHNRLLDEYLEENVFVDISAADRTLLVSCAPLTQLNNSLCESITGQRTVATTLDRLARQHLIIAPEDIACRWCSVRPIYAAYLRRQFDREEPEARELVHQRACRWFLENGLPREAIQHSLSIDDYSTILEIIRRHGSSMLADGELEILLSCTDLIPETKLANFPQVLLIFTWALVVAQRYFEAEKKLTELKSLLERNESAMATLLREVDDAEDHLLVVEYRIRQAIDPDWSDCIIWEDLRSSQPSSAHLILQHIELALATAYLRAGRYDDAFATYVATRSKSAATSTLITTLTATVRMAQIRKIQGRLIDALSLCDEALSIAGDLETPQAPVSGVAYLLRAQIRFELNDLISSRRDLRCAQALMERFKLAVYVVPAQILAAEIAGAKNGPSAALEELQGADRVSSNQGLQKPLEMARVAQAWFMIKVGDIEAAEAMLRILGAPVDNRGPNPTFACSIGDEMKYRPLCLFLIRTGRSFSASAWLSKLLHQAESEGRVTSRVAFGALLCLCHAVAGHRDRALRALRQTLILGEQTGCLRSIVDVGDEIADLLEKFREHRHSNETQSELGPGTDYLNTLIDVANGLQTGLNDSKRRALEHRGSESQSDEFVAPLTPRESEILAHISEGLSNRNISEELMIGEGTVKWHIKNVYSKLGVSSRTQAAAKAHSLRLV